MQNVLTPDEVATRLKISKKTVFRLIESGRLRAIRITRAIRIPEDAVQEFIGENSVSNAKNQQRKLSEAKFSLEGMFTEGGSISKEAIDKVIAEWERE